MGASRRKTRDSRYGISAKIEGHSLVIKATKEGREELAEAYERGGYPEAENVLHEALHEQFVFVQPDWIGALTDAPILVAQDDVDFPDDADHWIVRPNARVFWFTNYQVEDPWETLRAKGVVRFSEGDTTTGAKEMNAARRKRTPINGAKGVRIETEEHRRQYAAERASEDYYEAWMEAAGDWATRSELIDAWLVDHPEVVVGAWIDMSGIREMNASRRKRAPTTEQAGAQYAQDQIKGDYFKQWIFDQMIEAKAMAKRDPLSVMPLETKADYRKLAKNMLQQLTWDTKRDLNESKEFFEGFTEELEKNTTIDWLADELKSIHNHLHGKLDESGVQARPSKRSTDDRKAAWMRAFQDAATALGAVGRLVWHDAEYLYSQGVDSLTAARRIYGPRSSKPGDLQASRAPLALPSSPVRHRRRIGQKPLSARRRAR
jgi:hypothetical protein